MKTVRYKLRLAGSHITPWHSDTLFGSICWLILHEEGEKALNELLNLCKESNPPFVLSNGFPGDFLPKPFMPIAQQEFKEMSKEDLIKRAKEGKITKKIHWLSLQEMNDFIMQRPVTLKVKPEAFKSVQVYHNQVSRDIDTTGEEGQLYSQEETFTSLPYLSIYAKVKEYWKEKLTVYLKELGAIGFGKRRTVGKGVFEVLETEDFTGFATPENPGGFISLSNYVPAAKDPIMGYYKTFVKYGKISGITTGVGNPFKKPLLMLSPGSVFFTNGKVKDFYGRLIENVSDDRREVVQSGFTFALHISGLSE